MRPKLYVVVGSHPCAAVEAALGWKSIEYDRVELPTLSQGILGPLLFRGRTAPGMLLDGARIVGSRAIVHRLEQLWPEPPLLPALGSASRPRALRAERWGDEVFQNAGRRILDFAFLCRPSSMAWYAAEAKVQVPAPILRLTLPVAARLLARRGGASEESAREALSLLPAHLDRVDLWIEEGVLGAELPNCADLQIGSTIRLLLTIADVAPEIEGRPAAGLTRHFPQISGAVPANTLPSVWTAPDGGRAG